MAEHDTEGRRAGEYVVVARRYRPQSFAELVGQDQVSRALTNAINTNRVGHAYLFTGARGVGKTSTARILAKALNCAQGPTPSPCNSCDICLGVATGEDLDVLEIDGASNRGIDEIRQLRSNINVRPSRARFKIYIIDEVHMLTVQAFNALLKTLEEPPEHVKFIFCTTDVEKIPITVLSRCQRFDFPPVEVKSILDRLQFIVQSEGATADPEALQLLARRAAGSLRDSQSLLEQLLAFSGSKISVDSVHRMLGTARSGNLSQLIATLTEHNAAAALRAVDDAIHEGVDAGQLVEQLLGHYRDLMAAAVGCSQELMLHSLPADFSGLLELSQRLGTESILATIQILDQTVVRMRQSMHARILLEIAIVRICHLERLDDLAAIIGKLDVGLSRLPAPTPVPAPRVGLDSQAEKKNDGHDSDLTQDGQLTPVRGRSTASPASEAGSCRVPEPNVPDLSVPDSRVPDEPQRDSKAVLDEQSLRSYFDQALGQIDDDMTADFARFYDTLAILAPDRLAVRFRMEYNLQKQACERPDRKSKLEQALAFVMGRPISVTFESAATGANSNEKRPPVSRRQRMREMEGHPLVDQAKKLFEAEVVEITEGRLP